MSVKNMLAKDAKNSLCLLLGCTSAEPVQVEKDGKLVNGIVQFQGLRAIAGNGKSEMI